MNARKLSLISCGIYLGIGFLLGLFIPLPYSRPILIISGMLFGLIEWLSLIFGYMLPKIKGKLPIVSLFVYSVFSMGIFLPALWFTVFLFNKKLY